MNSSYLFILTLFIVFYSCKSEDEKTLPELHKQKIDQLDELERDIDKMSYESKTYIQFMEIYDSLTIEKSRIMDEIQLDYHNNKLDSIELKKNIKEDLEKKIDSIQEELDQFRSKQNI